MEERLTNIQISYNDKLGYTDKFLCFKIKTLTQLLESLGDRSVVVGRELTKLYEEIIRGNLSEVLEYFSKSKVKGEIVIMIGKKDDRIHF